MELSLGSLPFGLDFHPSDQLVAAALITGDLHLYRYNADSPPQKLLDLHAHEESCRAVRFVNGGQAMLTGSTDRSILATDVETGATIARLEDSHEDAIYSLINVTESTVASGDDQGCIKVVFFPSSCYETDMTFAADAMKLLGTRCLTEILTCLNFALSSGDGTLSVCNLRKNTVQTRSEFSEEELTSVVLMKNGRKVVCGSQSGTVLLYSWGYFKDCSDRFVGLSPNSVDALLKLDEDRVITGSENGLISLVGILPNRIIQPIAEHSEYPIESLGIASVLCFINSALSHDRKFLGSISHDSMLKLWDLDDILKGSGNNISQAAESDSDGDDMDVDNKDYLLLCTNYDMIPGGHLHVIFIDGSGTLPSAHIMTVTVPVLCPYTAPSLLP
ncbi:WD repeat-containing protein 55 [Citrus sinensis]|uniref:WD repeat-containing protein 55 n=1 Tax=Citrus sinensis TaxID=2711 RepID=A0ACB8MJF0_CITSI|nr:WD repeat-containing protein 55 [Citrus sinensis]